VAPDTFREFHHARRRTAALRGLAIALVAGVAATGLTLWGVAASSPSVVASVQARGFAYALKPFPDLQLPTLAVEPAAVEPTTVEPTTVGTATVETLASLPDTGSGPWEIQIDTIGHQAEIDKCDWVRMDLGAAAPIVGAHNYCGGDVVLDMDLGDTVKLSGTGLDGIYVVSETRDARAGDSASSATSGMVVAAILQTCYWGDDGRVRLVGLVPTF
jgi:hypothetical protein